MLKFRLFIFLCESDLWYKKYYFHTLVHKSDAHLPITKPHSGACCAGPNEALGNSIPQRDSLGAHKVKLKHTLNLSLRLIQPKAIIKLNLVRDKLAQSPVGRLQNEHKTFVSNCRILQFKASQIFSELYRSGRGRGDHRSVLLEC